MMKTSILGILLIMNSLVLFSQNITEKEKTWSIADFYSGGPEGRLKSCYYLKNTTDTIVNNNRYVKMMISNDSAQSIWKLHSLIRQENSKVYSYDLKTKKTNLLYDFSITAKDSFYWAYMGIYLNVDTVITKNSLKYFYLSLHNETTVWIEGIGCIDGGPLANAGNIVFVGGFSTLLCCTQNNTTLYKNEKYDNCFLTTEVPKGSFIEHNSLSQNAPNPFNESTDIKYFLPESVSNSQLNIYDMNGVQLRSIPVTQKGDGVVTIHASELRPGMYYYALIADGKEVDVKKMIITE